MPRRWSQPEPEQLPLFAGKAPTSQAAAASVAEHVPARREMVLAYVRRLGTTGATMEEISLALPARYSSVCPIVHGLAEDGKLQKAGTRLTTAGRPAAVYVAGQVQTGNLIGPTLPTKRTPAPRPNRWEQNQAAMLQRRREAEAEKVILRGRREKKTDEEIRQDLASAGLEWPR